MVMGKFAYTRSYVFYLYIPCVFIKNIFSILEGKLSSLTADGTRVVLEEEVM